MSLYFINPFGNFGVAPITINAENWFELGRTKLTGTSDNVTVSGLANVEYFMILADVIESPNLQPVIRLGDNGAPDVGANYANRRSDNGGADITSGTQNEIISNPNDASAKQWFHLGWVANLEGHEKLMVGRTARTQTGDNTGPNRSVFTGKWVNSPSNPIDTITLHNLGSGDFQAGTELVVLGFSRFANKATGKENFWEQLATVESTGGETSLVTGTFPLRKYLWIQSFFQATPGLAVFHLRVGNGSEDSGSNYPSRFNNDEGTDSVSTINILFATGVNSSGPRIEYNYYCVNKPGIEKLFHGRGFENFGRAGPDVGRQANTAKWVGQALAQINFVRLVRTAGPETLLAGSKVTVWGHD